MELLGSVHHWGLELNGITAVREKQEAAARASIKVQRSNMCSLAQFYSARKGVVLAALPNRSQRVSIRLPAVVVMRWGTGVA